MQNLTEHVNARQQSPAVGENTPYVKLDDMEMLLIPDSTGPPEQKKDIVNVRWQAISDVHTEQCVLERKGRRKAAEKARKPENRAIHCRDRNMIQTMGTNLAREAWYRSLYVVHKGRETR